MVPDSGRKNHRHRLSANEECSLYLEKRNSDLLLDMAVGNSVVVVIDHRSRVVVVIVVVVH